MFIRSGKCPHCGTVINRVLVEQILAAENSIGPQGWKAVAYVCPTMKCNAILSIQIDPVLLNGDFKGLIDGLSESTDQKIQRLTSAFEGLTQQLRILLQNRR